MYGERHRRLFEIDVVMARWVVLTRITGVNRCNKVQM